MKRRIRSSKEKARIVLEYLMSRNTAQICNKYSIHQNLLYRWKDEFLNNAHKAFELNNITRKEQSLSKEIQELKAIIGELTLELKKTENELY